MLFRSGFAEDVIDEVLDILEKEEYLNDKVYCEIFIEDKKKLNGYGKNKIKSLLIQKGISKNIFEDFLNEFEYDEEFDNALKMGIKKLELLSNEEDNFKKKQKIINYLTLFNVQIIGNIFLNSPLRSYTIKTQHTRKKRHRHRQNGCDAQKVVVSRKYFSNGNFNHIFSGESIFCKAPIPPAFRRVSSTNRSTGCNVFYKSPTLLPFQGFEREQGKYRVYLKSSQQHIKRHDKFGDHAVISEVRRRTHASQSGSYIVECGKNR